MRIALPRCSGFYAQVKPVAVVHVPMKPAALVQYGPAPPHDQTAPSRALPLAVSHVDWLSKFANCESLNSEPVAAAQRQHCKLPAVDHACEMAASPSGLGTQTWFFRTPFWSPALESRVYPTLEPLSQLELVLADHV